MASADPSRRVRASLQFQRLCPAGILGCPTCQEGVSRVLRGTANNWRHRLALGLFGTMAPAFFSVTAGAVGGCNATPESRVARPKAEAGMGERRVQGLNRGVGCRGAG